MCYYRDKRHFFRFGLEMKIFLLFITAQNSASCFSGFLQRLVNTAIIISRTYNDLSLRDLLQFIYIYFLILKHLVTLFV